MSDLRKHVPREVIALHEKLRAAGKRGWVVGGCVRDTLLGREIADWDVATDARPDEMMRIFPRAIPTGIQHGTITVMMQSKPIEVTTLRGEGAYSDGRRPDEVHFVDDITRDLARRDFTINAIAYHPLKHDWKDPFDGRADLDARVIRAVGDPNWRFQEDYLRILRALRFSARFEFRIHPRTLEAAKANAQGLAQLSAERVRDEWWKGIATAKRVGKLVALWRDIGAARIWLPEIGKAAEGKREPGNVDKLPRDPVLVSSLLASDPPSLLTRLKCSNRDIERARAIRDWRDKYPDPKHLPEVRRWLSRAGEYADDLLAILPAIEQSRLPHSSSRLPDVVRAVRDAQDPLSLADLTVKGDDLIAAGVRPGPEVGETLARLLDEVLEDPSRNTRDQLLQRVGARG